MRTKSVLLCLFLIPTTVQLALAQIPRTISYQGVLTESSGTPLTDGSYSLTVRLYEEESGGSAVWEEMHEVQLAGGLFNVTLGTATDLSIPFDRPYWISLSVDGADEMSPRSPLTSSPYSLGFDASSGLNLDELAIGMDHVNDLGPPFTVSVLTIAGDAGREDVVHRLATGGNSVAPFYWFVSSEGTLGAPLASLASSWLGVNASAAFDGSEFRAATYIVHQLDGATTSGSVPGQLSFWTSPGSGPQQRMIIRSSGNVGIGLPDPEQKLSVAGVVESTTGGFKFPDGTVQTSAGVASSPSALNAPDGDPLSAVIVDNDGIVGINQLSPSAEAGTKLDIGGNVRLTNGNGGSSLFERPFIFLDHPGETTPWSGGIQWSKNSEPRLELFYYDADDVNDGLILWDDWSEATPNRASFLFHRDGRLGINAYGSPYRLEIQGETSAHGMHLSVGKDNPDATLMQLDQYSFGPRLTVLGDGRVVVDGSASISGSTTVQDLSLEQNGRRGGIFFAGMGDFNHVLYNNISDIDGTGSFDGIKWNVLEGADIRTGCCGAWDTRLSIRPTKVIVNANLGIGPTVDPGFPLEMESGAHVTAGGVWTDASSRTLKEEIVPLSLDDALSALADLDPVTFKYKVEDERYVGFIAEDVPELVSMSDRKSLSPMDIVAVLTRVVKEQQEEIAVLQMELRSIKSDLK